MRKSMTHGDSASLAADGFHTSTALSGGSGPWGMTEGALRACENTIDSPQTKPYWNEYTPGHANRIFI